ncbi:MAG TPA: RDD family protein [Pseudonocardia sp.]|nr:RDD family protein [Pseudonocardia sp.]
MSDLVTGDAVVLELRLAKLPSRALAFCLDLAVMVTALTLLLLVLYAVTPAADGAQTVAVVIAVMIIVFVGYPVTVESLTRGRSLGKLALGLRVVREDGGPIRFRHALVRALTGLVVDFGLLSGFTGAIGVISSLASPRGRRVGDVLAGTMVVRERVATPAAAPFEMPPGLAGWAESLEFSRLPDGLALRARQFLGRVHELDPAHRASLGAALAEQVAARVGPAAPAGTAPEAYLAAVLVARRHRELARFGTRPAPAPGPPPSGPAEPDGPPEPEAPSDGFVLPR